VGGKGRKKSGSIGQRSQDPSGRKQKKKKKGPLGFFHPTSRQARGRKRGQSRRKGREEKKASKPSTITTRKKRAACGPTPGLPAEEGGGKPSHRRGEKPVEEVRPRRKGKRKR